MTKKGGYNNPIEHRFLKITCEWSIL